MKHRGTKILAMLLTLAMVVGLMPGMGFTAYADVPQEGSNKYVGYRHDGNGFIVYGKREKADGNIEEIQTTYDNDGYTTVMKVGESGFIVFNNFAYGKEYTTNEVKASVTARVRGKGVLVTYTLFNDSDEPKTVKIGSYADTQIYQDDTAPCSFTENGIKMTSVDGTLEFQLIPGGGNFTTRWYGWFYEAGDNVFNNRTDTSTFTKDSGIAWSWTIDIPARATITKTAELSAGQVGTKQIIYDANGGTGEMDPTVDIPWESIKLNKNTFTKDDCVFQGWDTNSAGTTVVYADEATLTMPETDTTLYAVWKANANAVPATVTANNRTYDGTEQPLVTVSGEPVGGEMQYAIGTETAATQPYTTSIPTATNAGTYYVWYKAKGDASHSDYVCPQPVVSTISINTYTVTVYSGYNGSATADKTTAAAGETVTLTITPASGYEVLAIAASDADDNQITVTNNSFTMPASNVIVTVQFKAKTTPQPTQPTPTPQATQPTPTPQATQPTPTPQPAQTTYIVSFFANGGGGVMNPVTVPANTSYTLPACSFTPPAGKQFKAWQLGSTEFAPGSAIIVDSNAEFVALWKDAENNGQPARGDIVFIGGSTGEDEWSGYVAPQRAWKVSLAPMVNGSAALGLMTGESTTTEMNVYPNTTIYVFPNANPGFVLDKIVWSLIDGSASYDITESRNFVMPAMDAVVYVTFRPAG